MEGLTDGCVQHDPSTGKWRAAGSMKYQRSAMQGATLPSGRVLVVGGLGGQLSVYRASIVSTCCAFLLHDQYVSVGSFQGNYPRTNSSMPSLRLPPQASYPPPYLLSPFPPTHPPTHPSPCDPDPTRCFIQTLLENPANPWMLEPIICAASYVRHIYIPIWG